MRITIERVGGRVYFGGDTFAAKSQIKEIGGHWDGARRQWWVGAAKLAAAQELVAELAAPVMVATDGSRAAAASVGLDPDTPAGVVADAMQEAGHRGADSVRTGGRAQRPAGEVRLTGKGTYQGRTYYVGPQTRDGQRVLICGLPREDGTYYERWVPAAEVTITRTYEAREVWDGRRYSGRTELRYQTLGGIASFIRRQQQRTHEARADEHRGTPTPCGRRDCRALRGQWCSDCHDEDM